jgi:arylformamidase
MPTRVLTRTAELFGAVLIVFSILVGPAARDAWAVSLKDVPYGPAGAENTLDVQYQPDKLSPLIVFVHGGGWDKGDKRAGTRLLARFSPDYAYASINYRLAPNAAIKDAASDVARAVAYLQQHAVEYSVDPKRIVLMGHSAGAHLVALAAVDPKYFANAGVPPESIRGVVLLDCGGCDLEGDMAKTRNAQMREIFSSDPQMWKVYSPAALASGATRPPPFMITYSPDRRRSVGNAEPLAAALTPHCQACVLKPYSKEHMSFLRDLANPDDPMTKDILDFLKARFGT